MTAVVESVSAAIDVDSGADEQLSLTAPSGVTSTDSVYIFCYGSSSFQEPDLQFAASGFHQVHGVWQITATAGFFLYAGILKNITPQDGVGTYTVDATTAIGVLECIAVRVSGDDGTTIGIDGFGMYSALLSSSGSMDLPEVTTSVDDCLVLTSCLMFAYAGTPTINDTVTGRTAHAFAPSSSIDLTLWEGVQASAGATGTPSSTLNSPNTTDRFMMTVAIRPDGATGGMPRPRVVGELDANASGTTIEPAIPPTAEAGDFMIVPAMANGSTTFTTPSGGWAVLGTEIESNSNQSSEFYWKIHDGSEADPAITTSATLSTSLGGYGRVWVFEGCDPTTPFADVTMAGSPTNDNNPDTAAIDTTEDNSLAVCFLVADDDNTWSSGRPPSGWMPVGQRASSTTGGDAMLDAIATFVPTAGSVSAATFGTMSGADYWRTLTLALNPVAASAIDLTVADMAVACAMDAPTLTQTHVLVVQDATVACAIESPTLTQVHVLAVDDMTVGVAMDNVVLATEADLVVADLTIACAIESPTLTQVHVLTVADMTVACAIESPTLTQTHVLTVADATVAVTMDNVVLSLADAPDAPTEVRPSNAFGYDSEILLEWVAPADDGGATITGYTIGWSTNDGSSWTTYDADTGNDDEFATLTGLTNYTRYLFRVAAINSAGTGGYAVSEWGASPWPEAAAQTQPSTTTRTGSGWAISRIDQTALPVGTTATSTWTGAGVRVYVIDSGVRVGHDEFDGLTVIDGFWPAGASTALADTEGHGTSVASNAVGLTVGVAYEATLVAVRMYVSSTLGPADPEGALEWVRDNHPPGTPGVVCSSIAYAAEGDTSGRDAMQAIVSEIINDTGLAFVQCMHNTFSTGEEYFLPEPGLIFVAGSTEADAVWTGSLLDDRGVDGVFAPGDEVPCAVIASDSSYDDRDGTSFAAPLVAGVIACWLEGNPTLTPRQLHDLVRASSTKDVLSGDPGDVPNRLVYSLADVPPPQTVNLTVADMTVACAMDNVALAQTHVLTVADATVATTIDAPTLTQVHQLTVADMSVAVTADSPTLTQAHVLVVADLTVAVTIDNITLTQVHVLDVDDMTVAVTMDNVELSSEDFLGVQDITVAVTMDSPTLTQVHQLVVADLAVGVAMDAVTLAQAHNLTVADLAVAVTIDNVVLELDGTLGVNDMTVAVTMDSVVLTQTHVLTIQDMTVAVTMTHVIWNLTPTFTGRRLTTSADVDDLRRTTTGTDLARTTS